MQIFGPQKMLKLVSLRLEAKTDMTSHVRTGLRYFVEQYTKLQTKVNAWNRIESHQVNIAKCTVLQSLSSIDC
jgi:hypothetical protein